MNEIYWLTRLDGVLTIFGVLLTLSVVAVLSMGLLYLIDGYEEILMSAANRRKILNRSLIIVIISGLMVCFVPSSKTAMAIWGVGTVIDYVQETETLNELPDKCVKALEAWADSLTDEEE